MNSQDIQQQLEDLATKLHKANTAEDEAGKKYKALEGAWLESTPEAKAEAEAKKQAATDKKDYTVQAKALLADFAATGKPLASNYFTLKYTNAETISNPDAVVSAIVEKVPGLAAQVLTINESALRALMGTNPALAALLGPQNFTIDKAAHKTTIHWSRLGEKEATPVQVSVSVAEKCVALLDKECVYLAMETTGFGITDEPVDICIIDKQGEEIYHSQFFPSAPMNSEAEKAHGISEADLLSAPRLARSLQSLRAALEGKKVIAYNADFAKRLLKQGLAEDGAFVDTLKWECAMKLYAKWKGGKKAYKLADAVEQSSGKAMPLTSTASKAHAVCGIMQHISIPF